MTHLSKNRGMENGSKAPWSASSCNKRKELGRGRVKAARNMEAAIVRKKNPGPKGSQSKKNHANPLQKKPTLSIVGEDQTEEKNTP